MEGEDKSGGLVLVEGVDYLIERGRWVFTSYYLKRRGYCCGNGCRNCPYGELPIADCQLPIEGDGK